jgi:hypothetical protein
MLDQRESLEQPAETEELIEPKWSHLPGGIYFG